MNEKKTLLTLAGLLVAFNGVGLAMTIVKMWVDSPLVQRIGTVAYLGGAITAFVLLSKIRRMMKEVQSQEQHEER